MDDFCRLLAILTFKIPLRRLRLKFLTVVSFTPPQSRFNDPVISPFVR